MRTRRYIWKGYFYIIYEWFDEKRKVLCRVLVPKAVESSHTRSDEARRRICKVPPHAKKVGEVERYGQRLGKKSATTV